MHDPGSSHPASVSRALADAAATTELGVQLARGLQPGMIVYLRGELGAGKTTLVRGVLRGFGYRGRVKSPTYTLVEVYEISRLYLYHFDFYRLERDRDWIDAGFREYFDGGAICLVEWPERAGRTLPPADLDIVLALPQGSPANGREALLTAHTEAGRKCLSALPS